MRERRRRRRRYAADKLSTERARRKAVGGSGKAEAETRGGRDLFSCRGVVIRMNLSRALAGRRSAWIQL